MGWFDRVLRAVAVVAALTVVVVAAMNSQLPLNFSSSAEKKQGPSSRDDLRREAAAAQTRGYAYLLSSPDHLYPARWCAGNIGFHMDTTMLADARLDTAEEVRRWDKVFQEWSRASQGRYTFSYLGERKLTMNADGEPDVNSVEPGTIGITYVHGDPDGAEEYRSTAVRGRTAGNGGLQVISRGDSDAGALLGDRGFVLIDVDDAADLAADGLRRSLYQHESGHALGLGHVEDDRVLMNGTLSNERSRITASDQAGLRSLLEMPCVP